MKRSHSSLLSAAAILLCTAFGAHAQAIGTFACTSGANSINLPISHFNVGASVSPVASILSSGTLSGSQLEINAGLNQFGALFPLATKTATLRNCTLTATLPTGHNVLFTFSSITVQQVNAVANAAASEKKPALGHTALLATFTGFSDQSSGGTDDGGSGNLGSGTTTTTGGGGTTTTPPAPR